MRGLTEGGGRGGTVEWFEERGLYVIGSKDVGIGERFKGRA